MTVDTTITQCSPKKHMDQYWWTTAQVARYLRVDARSFRSWSPMIPLRYSKLFGGKRRMYPVQSIDPWLVREIWKQTNNRLMWRKILDKTV